MMAPLPNPPPANDRPELPRVRLEVRSGSGRTISYEVGSDEFLIGGASGCDLRLPVPNAPSVVCQLTRKADAVRVSWHTTAGAFGTGNRRSHPPAPPIRNSSDPTS